ncbi:pentapeptide repeat-containing protein [Sporofaciens sp. SGI.106]|uniref:pentapeptide repeat-containing protein n=1 Tax=Sporofaciens sp. SGI.106 TaxID=3420568 RepID=UPI003D019BFB
MSEVKGYKVFNHDWTCRGFQYEVGKTFEEDVKPETCNRGFHFCEKASDCFSYYPFNPENKVAEVIALGDVDSDGTKSCTNKIHIVREIPWDEVLRIVNTGKDCTGLCNTGDCNTGNRNTGDWNTGDWNTGNRNTGDCNTGNRNTGDWNTGDWNTGNRNTGDWNKSSFNTGCFNTVEQKIMLFNEPSDWTYNDWMRSDARYLLNRIPKDVVEWVYSYDMTDEEKAANPTYKTTGGYLKILDESERGQLWWNGLSEHHKNIIKDIPNFDAEIFEQCTGIKVEK